MATKFDVVVIGGGAAGLFAASVASTAGVKTCIIDKKRLGGDCTWFGCMPSKALLKSASIAQCLRKHSQFGIDIKGDFQIDTNKVLSHVQDIVKEISTHHKEEDFEKRGIKVIIGSPKFINKRVIEVNGEKLKAKRFIICTGSGPVIPPIEGLGDVDCLTNENIFSIEKLPESLIVLGGGPIGIELSQALNRLGVKVSIIEMMDRVLVKEDREVSLFIEETLRKEGIKLFVDKKAVKFKKGDGMVFVTLQDRNNNQEEIFAENILVAVGRSPNIEGLSLEKARVKYTKKGLIVNDYLQTTNKIIFGCGDIVGPYQFSHVAAYQAVIAVRNALTRRLVWQKANYQNVAWATFTEPELAHLGLTEDEARKKHNTIKVYKTEYAKSDRAVTDVEKEGLVKVITDKKGYILGAHIAGAQSAEVIQGLLVAKSLRIKLSKLSGVLYIYPTISELVKKTAAKSFLEELSNSPFVKLLIKAFRKIK